MTSDNEDEDLDALREAALATLKQKVQPIENVFSGGITAHTQNPSIWTDVPASIDFPAFADPIPDSNHFPLPYDEPTIRPPPHNLFRPTRNLPWQPPSTQPTMVPPYHHQQRIRHPGFPQRTFGDMRGPFHERGNWRMGRGRYLPPPQRGNHHPTNFPPPQNPVGGSPVLGANLIVIQPHTPSRDETISTLSFAHSEPVHNSISTTDGSTNTISSRLRNNPQPESSQARSKLVLPQDKYHTSVNSTSTLSFEDKESGPEVRTKDKFSRYDTDKSDSEDDDLSEVDDIAKEIDKVLQDDFLADEVTAKEAEEAEVIVDGPKAKMDEEGMAKDEVESEPDQVTSEKQETVDDDPKTPIAESTNESDVESLDLDALAGGEPVIGDFEDLDCLVEKEPENVLDSSDIENVIDSGSRQYAVDSKNDDNSIDRAGQKSEVGDDYVSSSTKETDICEKNRNVISSDKQSPLRRPSLSPPYRNTSSPPRHRSPLSPTGRYDYTSHHKRFTQSRRSQSPWYGKHMPYRRSTSPRSSLRRSRSRSPYHQKSPLRSSISPRRRAGSPRGSHLSNRRYELSPQRFPGERGRRRSLSPLRKLRSQSPRDRYRPNRQDGVRYRDYNNSRAEEDRIKAGVRYRDRPRLATERDRFEVRSGNQNRGEIDVKGRNTDKRVSPVNKRISPLMEKNTLQEDKVNIDLDKLSPEERVRIEARRKKFDNREEVKVTEAAKKISLKDIKKREKKTKKKEKEDKEETAVEEEALPNVSKKTVPGISLRKLRKKQESKKQKEDVEQESPKAVGLADLEDESENDSDEGRSWRKESSVGVGSRIKFDVSRTIHKAPLLSLDTIRSRRRDHVSSRKPFVDHRERNSNRDRERVEKIKVKPHRMRDNKWSSGEDEDDVSSGATVSRLSSSVVQSKPFEADVPPNKLRIHVKIASKDSKKKSKAVPDFSKVYSVHAKRRRGDALTNSDEEEKSEGEEVVPLKKAKKKKEKKKKHSRVESVESSNAALLDEMEMLDTSLKLPAKPSVLERLGKKVSLKSIEKEKKKKSKKSRDVDGDPEDLDVHIRKMKAKNQEILRRQREIELDKERYG